MPWRLSDEGKWRAIQVLMVLIALQHGLQPLLLSWRPKFYVATAGALLYGTCAVLLFLRHRLGLYIAIVGPITGTLTLSTGALLMALGVLQVPFRQDVYTLLGGLLQIPALVLAVLLLRRRKAEA